MWRTSLTHTNIWNYFYDSRDWLRQWWKLVWGQKGGGSTETPDTDEDKDLESLLSSTLLPSFHILTKIWTNYLIKRSRNLFYLSHQYDKLCPFVSSVQHNVKIGLIILAFHTFSKLMYKEVAHSQCWRGFMTSILIFWKSFQLKTCLKDIVSKTNGTTNTLIYRLMMFLEEIFSLG